MNIMNNLNFKLKSTLPIVLQSEANECGLACLAMIAQYHGKTVNLRGLKNKFSVSNGGVSLQSLMEVAQTLGFTARAIRCEVDELKQLKTPAILHWNFNHFVVLKKVSKNKIIIHDPALGVVHYSFAEVSEAFTGVALELSSTIDFNALDTGQLKLRHFFANTTGLLSVITQIFLVSIALEIFAIISPLFMQFVTDDVLTTKDYQLLELLCIGFTLLLIVQVFAGYARSWAVQYLSVRLNFQLSNNLFHHLIRLPISFFEKRHLGDVISRFGSMKTIQTKISTDVIEGILDGVMVLGTLMIMIIYNKLLTLIVSCALLLYVILRFASYPYFRRMNEKSLHISAKQSTIFMESIRSVLPVKLFAKETQRQSQWQTSYIDTINISTKITKTSLFYGLFNQLSSGIEYTVIIYLGSLAVINNTFSIGMLIAYLTYRSQFVARAKSLVDKLLDYRMINLHLERIADIALEETEVKDLAQCRPYIELQGKVEAHNIAFAYSKHDKAVLKNISFSINPGEIVAITGSSGMGKTTLMKLMLQLVQPTEGEILYDGYPITKIGLNNFRMQTAAVMQNDALLSGSILENITFFAEKPDIERATLCANLASIHQEIMQMPMQYQTLIGDMGSMLSGGQKQRILFARALYAKPKILFLDEASSHLDTQNESYINQNIKRLGITCIMIAHRKETIDIADRVIDLSQLITPKTD